MKDLWKSVRFSQSYLHQLVVKFLGHSVYNAFVVCVLKRSEHSLQNHEIWKLRQNDKSITRTDKKLTDGSHRESIWEVYNNLRHVLVGCHGYPQKQLRGRWLAISTKMKRIDWELTAQRLVETLYPSHDYNETQSRGQDVCTRWNLLPLLPDQSPTITAQIQLFNENNKKRWQTN